MRKRISDASPPPEAQRACARARAGQSARPATVPAVLVERLKLDRVALRTSVRALMADRLERYAVQVATELGLDPSRAYSRVKSALNVLEADGELRARLVYPKAGDLTGLPRKYFRAVG